MNGDPNDVTLLLLRRDSILNNTYTFHLGNEYVKHSLVVQQHLIIKLCAIDLPT